MESLEAGFWPTWRSCRMSESWSRSWVRWWRCAVASD